MKNKFLYLGGFIILGILLLWGRWPGGGLLQGEPSPAPVQCFPAPQTSFPLNVELKAALVYERADSPVLAAYQQILAEEGFPYALVPAETLLKYTAKNLKETYAALILPEEVNRRVAPAVVNLLQEYVFQGGKVLLGADAGTVEQKNGLRKQGLFSSLAGIQPRVPDSDDEKQVTVEKSAEGILFIPEKSPLHKDFDPCLFDRDMLRVFDCPPVKDNYLPLTNVTASILAYAGQENNPANGYVLQKNYPGGGVVLTVNGTPGRLKVEENVDFVLRSLLKYFLLELVGLPRLVASPGGVAGLVVAMHICSGAYFRDLDRILARKLLSPDVPFSFYVTAGPDNDRPGDKRGVDVLNPKKGRRYVEALASYGSIGAHGGWSHNYWAYHYNELNNEEKREYIDRNYQALREVTGRPVTDYAAPGGAHDPIVNDFLAAWGTKAASVPVAFNSPPTYAWFNGRQERRFWFFGYTGTTYGTAFENMLAGGRKPALIEADVRQLLDFLVKRREIRLLYFHPVSIASHPEMWRAIQSHLLLQIENGNLMVRTMNDFADFLTRHQKVRFSVRKSARGYYITATSPDSLKEMTFALPVGKNTCGKIAAGLKIKKDRDGWAYVAITRDVNKVAFLVPVNQPSPG